VVAEVAKALDRTLAMHPICGEIGYEAMIAVVAVREIAEKVDGR
jgi:hypothetical protein